MPRELSPDLEDLIDSGHSNCQTAMDIELTGGEDLYFSTGETFVPSIPRQYLAKLNEEHLGSLEMSLSVESDQIQFGIANVDTIMGQSLTGSERKLDGARCINGVIFSDPEGILDPIYDAKMPGEIVAGEVTDEVVNFSLISDVDSVVISGRTISSEFQWRQPLSNVPVGNPDDLGPIFVDPDLESGGRTRGRIPSRENPFLP